MIKQTGFEKVIRLRFSHPILKKIYGIERKEYVKDYRYRPRNDQFLRRHY